MRSLLIWGLVVGAGLSSSISLAAEFLILDFDNTIVELRKERDGAFSTPIRLFRHEHRSTTLQKKLTGPKEIEVSYIDYQNLQKYLATDEYNPGALKRQSTLQDGRVITPGHYYLRLPQSYYRFRPGDDGTNYLLEDFKAAEQRVKESNGKSTFQGPMWDQMVQMLSTEESAQRFGLVTARGHTEAEWREFFEYLQSKGYVAHVPQNYKLIFNVSLPEFDRFDDSRMIHKVNIARRKAGILIDYLIPAIDRMHVGDGLTLDANTGKTKVAQHYLAFGDDQQTTVEAVFDEFQKATQSRRFPIKFGVFNAGNATEIKATNRPVFTIFREDGSIRRAHFGETFGPPGCEKAMKKERARKRAEKRAQHQKGKQARRSSPKNTRKGESQ